MKPNHPVTVLARGIAATALLLFLGETANAGTLYLARLSAANENPPTTSTATGNGVLILNDAENQATITATHTISIPVTGGHIHRGTATLNGPVIFPFPAPTSPVGPLTWSIPIADVDNLKNLGLYMNFHTAVNPGGAIRATLVRALLAPAAASPAQLRLANALDISAGYSTDLDQILIQTNFSAAVTQTSTLGDLTAGTVYTQGLQEIEAMANLQDGLLAYVDEARSAGSTAGRFSGFLRGGSDFGKRPATPNQAGATVSRPFVFAGIDWELGSHGHGGFALGLAQGKDSFHAGAGQTKTKMAALQGFLALALGDTGVSIDATAGYGSGRIDTTRNLTSLGRVATGSPDGKVWTAALRAAKPLALSGNATFQPYALVDVQKATVDGYTEAGAGAASLIVPQHTTWNSAFEAGASLLLPVKLQSGSLSVRLQAGWHCMIEEGAGSFSTWLTGSPIGFTTQLDGARKNTARVEASLTKALPNGSLATLGYRGLLGGGGRTMHTIEARLVLKY